MILLLGGTAETASIALALAERGHDVLVSTATDVPLEVGHHERIRQRRGRLDESAMVELLQTAGISWLIDAAHPYAELVHRTARAAAQTAGIAYIAYVRPPALREDDPVQRASSHEQAAQMAFATSRGKPVLLTVGSRNLAPYVQTSRQTTTPLFARVLEHPESVAACRAAGIPDANVIAGRGPFSKEQNRAVLTDLGVGVLVTKDGGDAGGLRAKIEAAREMNVAVVVVERPNVLGTCTVQTVEALICAQARLGTSGDSRR